MSVVKSDQLKKPGWGDAPMSRHMKQPQQFPSMGNPRREENVATPEPESGPKPKRKGR